MICAGVYGENLNPITSVQKCFFWGGSVSGLKSVNNECFTGNNEL